jgi:hypothetical protein
MHLNECVHATAPAPAQLPFSTLGIKHVTDSNRTCNQRATVTLMGAAMPPRACTRTTLWRLDTAGLGLSASLRMNVYTSHTFVHPEAPIHITCVHVQMFTGLGLSASLRMRVCASYTFVHPKAPLYDTPVCNTTGLGLSASLRRNACASACTLVLGAGL